MKHRYKSYHCNGFILKFIVHLDITCIHFVWHAQFDCETVRSNVGQLALSSA